MDKVIKEIKEQISSNQILLFMKGTPYQPQCGFSAKVSQILFEYDDNPNGSMLNIAGITNKKRNVLGMMPHPERASDNLLGSNDGRLIFESVLNNYA